MTLLLNLKNGDSMKKNHFNLLIIISIVLFSNLLISKVNVSSVKLNYEYNFSEPGFAHFYFSLPYFYDFDKSFQSKIYNDLEITSKKNDTITIDKLNKYINSRFEEYQKSFTEIQSEPMELSGFTLEQSFKINEILHFLSISIFENSFYGGAHPNSNITHLVYNLNTKTRVTYNDLFTDVDEFQKIAEKKFRNLYKIQNGMPLSSSGFQFENDKFSLSEFFYIENDGIVLFWNAYDIAPYAFGPILIKVKFKELDSILKETSLKD